MKGTSITMPLGSTGGTVLTRVVGARTVSARRPLIVSRVGSSQGPGSRSATQAPSGENTTSDARAYHHPPSCTPLLTSAITSSRTTGTRPATR